VSPSHQVNTSQSKKKLTKKFIHNAALKFRRNYIHNNLNNNVMT